MDTQRMERWEGLREMWLSAPKGSGSTTSVHTRKAYETASRQWLEFLGTVAPWEARAEHVRIWQRHMTRELGLAQSTVNARLAAVSSLYTFVLADAPGEIESNPFEASTVRRPKVRPYGKAHPLGPERLKMLFEYTASQEHTVAGARNHALLLTYFLTGCRVSEVVRMRWGDIRPSRSNPEEWVFAWTGKGGKREVSPLPGRAYRAIVWMLTLRDWTYDAASYLWLPVTDHGTGNLISGERKRPHISTANANRILRQSLRNAGVRDWELFRIHDLRHSFAHLHYQQTKDLESLRKLLHHSSVATTGIYVRSMDDPVDDHSAAVWAALHIA